MSEEPETAEELEKRLRKEMGLFPPPFEQVAEEPESGNPFETDFEDSIRNELGLPFPFKKKKEEE